MDVLTAKYILSDKSLTVILSGEIDHHSVKELREEIDSQIFVHRLRTVYLDLKNVSFMDSSGLGLILGRYTHAKEVGSILKILNPGQSAARMLKLAGTDKIIPIEWTEETN